MQAILSVFALSLLTGCTNETEKQAQTEDDSPNYPDIEFYDFSEASPWYLGNSVEYPEEVTVVTAMNQEYQYFGGEDKRTVEVDVDFPETGDWAQVGLYFRLECPENGLCDHWDRSGSLQLMLNPDTEEQIGVELLRHITPYRIEMTHYIDVTPLAGLLKGTQRLNSFIDTWVGPGHSDGEGWRVTAEFVFYPGPPAEAEVIPIWGRRNITVGQTEDGETIADQIEAVTFEIPEDATKVKAHLITTGHSFGNTYNCAEFCQMRHDMVFNGETFSTYPWREDRAENPVSPQYGTWEYPRNGWCPGGVAVGQVLDITESLVIGGSNTLDFDILLAGGSPYVNASPVDLLPYTITSLRLYVYR